MSDLAPRCQVEHCIISGDEEYCITSGHEEHCITCGDEAVPMRVCALDRARGLALCERGDGRRETVEIALLDGIAVAETVLVHAGVALQRVPAAPAGEPDRRSRARRVDAERRARATEVAR